MDRLTTDGHTIFYTSQGRKIFKFNTTAQASSVYADLSTVSGGSNGELSAIRILPPGDGNDGVLVADQNIKLVNVVNGVATIVQTYHVGGQNDWEALNLDPNGTSFWAGDATTHNFYRFNIATGKVEVGPINTNASLGGICVDGAFSAAQPRPTAPQAVTVSPTSNSADFTTPSGTKFTVTLVGLTTSINLTFRSSLVDRSTGVTDSPVFTFYPGIPPTQVTESLPCTLNTSNQCEVYEIEASADSGYSGANYHVLLNPTNFPNDPNPRLIRDMDEDITTTLELGGGTKTKCTFTVNQQTSVGTNQSCGFASPVSGQSFNQGATIPFKFQAAPNATDCQNGPFLTNLQPLLLIVQVFPTVKNVTPAPQSIQVVVAGNSGGPPIFNLGGTNSNGNNTTYQLQVQTSNMPVGDYFATAIDLNSQIPAFGTSFSLQ